MGYRCLDSVDDIFCTSNCRQCPHKVLVTSSGLWVAILISLLHMRQFAFNVAYLVPGGINVSILPDKGIPIQGSAFQLICDPRPPRVHNHRHHRLSRHQTFVSSSQISQRYHIIMKLLLALILCGWYTSSRHLIQSSGSKVYSLEYDLYSSVKRESNNMYDNRNASKKPVQVGLFPIRYVQIVSKSVGGEHKSYTWFVYDFSYLLSDFCADLAMWKLLWFPICLAH